MDMASNTLFFSATSYGGMGMASYSVLNTFNADDNVFFFVVEQKQGFYKSHIKESLLHKTKIVYYKQNRWEQLVSVIYEGIPPYYDELLHFCKENGITVIFQYSSPVYPRMIKQLKDVGIKYIANVHDLHPHSANKAFYKEWKQRVMYSRINKSFEICNGLVTNEIGQYNEMQDVFPNKIYAYHELPTSVTKEIINGNKVPSELLGVKKQLILFFGRIEDYKGVPLLYNVFYNHKDINERYVLVIAGQGDIKFRRYNDEKEKNIYIINRFIDDAEVRYLYEKSACVVYPYTSITQTGILSFPFYFGVPVVTSNLKAFSDKLLEETLGFVFENGEEADLYEKLRTILARDNKEMKEKQRLYYNKIYGEQSFRGPLLEIFEKVNKM